MNRELICIGCPMGCHLTVTVEKNEVIEVAGNTCPRGAAYARNESTNPVRMLTTTVNIRGAMYPLLSVRTTKPIPKTMLKESVNYLREIQLKAPVQAGQVIVKNILNTGADIIATKNLERDSQKR